MANGKEEAEIIRKGNKNFSGQGGGGEGEGGETKVQNSPKAFGELKNKTSADYSQEYTITILSFGSP